MVNGILILESGLVQQIGELQSLQGIINTLKKILPELEEQEYSRVLATISDDELLKLVEQRRLEK
jgi:hypothetical protein